MTLNTYQRWHKTLIEAAGGKMEGIFVLKTGVMMTKRSAVSAEAKQLFAALNLDCSREPHEQHAEFNSRLTYLSFKDEPVDGAEYHKKMIHEYGHRGVCNDEYVTFLVAGCAVETELEFLAHNEASIARLTSSKTKAQDEGLYKLVGDSQDSLLAERQKEWVARYIEWKREHRWDSPLNREVANLCSPGNKAVSFTITMSIKDWHKTLIGRLSHQGVETDMLAILEDIAGKLKNFYPIFFNSTPEYYAMGNQEKYIEVG